MLDSRTVVQLLVVVVQLFIGILANGLIVVVNGIDLIKHRKPGPLDLLLSCLAASRICLQLFILVGQLVILSLLKHSVLVDNFLVIMFINELCLWLATWLGVFYCAKIATIPHPLFLWLKARISRLVPWLILGSMVYAAMTIGIHGKYSSAIARKIFRDYFCRNATVTREIEAIPFFFLFLGLTLPMFIFLVAVHVLIFSLWKHGRQMRAMAADGRERSRHIHLNATLSILSFLFLYFSHYIVAILLSSQAVIFGSQTFLLCILITGIYPSIHSAILIVGNPKLKQNAKTLLCCGKCCQ